MLGSIVPRLHTRPRRELTPATSDGFAVVEFAADVLGRPLDEWQQWLLVHALEKLDDGRPRFRRLVCLVSRQAGKSTLLAVLAVWKLWRDERCRLVWGLSAVESTAREAWDVALDMAEAVGLPLGVTRQGRTDIVTTNGRVGFSTADGSRYRISAANRRGGRGYPLDLVFADELREQRTWDSYDATVPAMNARPHAQWWGISNAGDETATVLWALHKQALDGLDDPDSRIGLFEWSADPALAADDPRAWVQAQPQLGRRVPVDVYEVAARAAVKMGGEVLSRFETEMLCRKVALMNPAVDPHSWDRCLDVGTLEGIPHRVLCVDMSPDQLHASAVLAGALPDGRCRVDVVEAYEGLAAGDQLRRALPALVGRFRPAAVGWYPQGPAASLLKDMRPRDGWPPPGTTVAPLSGEIAAVCMAFAGEVAAATVVHSGDELLDAHVRASERLARPGGTWVFSRKQGRCDSAYAAAGAVFLARTQQTPVTRREFVFVDG